MQCTRGVVRKETERQKKALCQELTIKVRERTLTMCSLARLATHAWLVASCCHVVTLSSHIGEEKNHEHVDLY